MGIGNIGALKGSDEEPEFTGFTTQKDIPTGDNRKKVEVVTSTVEEVKNDG